MGIAERIAAGMKMQDVKGRKCITFHDYMALCLYDPEYGYYRQGNIRVGRNGDFYTSSSIGTIMGEKIAACLAEWQARFGGRADAAEWGAGTGMLSKHILQELAKCDPAESDAMRYALIDDSPVHLAAARRLLDSFSGSDRLCLLTADQGWAGLWRRGGPLMIVANELLDAMPVHRVLMKEDRLWEIGVTLTDRPEAPYAETLLPPSDPQITRVLECDGIALREGQQAEVNLNAERWIARIGEQMEEGVLILIDYGHDAEELTAGHRMNGTLLCYAGHLAHDDPYARPGEQDITAHVNFTACRRAAEAAGFRAHYYATQKQFLLDYGVLDDLTAHAGVDPFGPAARRNRAIRQLLLSDGMSETFKVMVLHKGT
ncbi:class I SAM-dependent methyltransferase [Paenibacillus methanolicus]|uniref:SAM-dependent MidA family methyltransferase n=1 Tax=Paenibacillus methanolicus TaxID=582686 RepID=A0A5S5CHI4_9BACL|nr:SAM-dependent methyltransferase [Paenibacillus methanolicus]TYP77972.1 SAM-dependent MidA family methyltransferase [Paenibacillus methanolicus]